VKIINRSKMKWGGRDALQDEIENLRMVKEGPSILQFQDVFYKKELCYLVTELISGGVS
jgi:serine/threonine protein kinase